MKHFVKAWGMLCVVFLLFLIYSDQEKAVKADESCLDALQLQIDPSLLTIKLNEGIPNYKEDVMVYDSCHKPVTDFISTVIDEKIKPDAVGTYPLGVYVLTNNNQVGAAKMDVKVTEDTIPPVITDYHEKYLYQQGTELTEDIILNGVKATDNFDGDISNQLSVDLTTVDTNTVNDYPVDITVSDLNGNQTKVPIEIVILNEIPDLIPKVNYSVNVESTMDYTQDLSGLIIKNEPVNYHYDDSNINYNLIGDYKVHILADVYNLHQEKDISVQVVDRTPPVVNGIRKISIMQGMEFKPSRYITAYDLYNHDVTNLMVIEGHYDVDKPSRYLLTAKAYDESGNSRSYPFTLVVEKQDHELVLWTTVTLGIVVVGASGILYFIRKRKD